MATIQTIELIFSEEVRDVDSVQYTFTVEQLGATAAGVVNSYSIEVEVING